MDKGTQRTGKPPRNPLGLFRTLSVLSRFTKRVGVDRLERIIEEKVAKLLKGNRAEGADAVLDTSFMKAVKAVSPTYFNT